MAIPYLALLFSILLGSNVRAFTNTPYSQERITNFDSQILINADSSLTVTETIRVYASGDKIKRGIYRDFPTKYKDAKGINYQTSFDVLEVLRDGTPEDYHTGKLSNGRRLYIGNKDVYLTPGFYTYTIKYKTANQLGFFKDHDELYFNVTGNGWDFVIDSATATIQLPQGLAPGDIKLEAYTGPIKGKGKDHTSEVYLANGATYALFKTTSPLNMQEGLTVVVGWPKGFVFEPTQSQKLLALMINNIVSVVGLTLLLVVFMYYLIVWPRYGRDPQDVGTVVTQYELAKYISPAGARYINRMGFDNKAVTASLVNMALKRFIKIVEAKNGFSIELLERGKLDLFPEEKILLERYFLNGAESFEFKTKNALRISNTIKLFKKSLEKEYLDKYVKTNRGFLVVPLIVNLLFLAVISLANPANLFLLTWLAFWSIGVVVIVTIIVKPALDSIMSGGKITKTQFGNLAFSAPFILAELGVLAILAGSAGVIPAVTLFIMFILNALGAGAMKARTPEGRKIQDQIMGLKSYLTAVESPRYTSKINYELPDNLNVYEKYLPYAIALDVEPIWTSRFKEQIESAQSTEIDGSSLYYGSDFYTGSVIPGTLGSALTSAISSSAAPPGSSSGFSGGGGGGGSSGGGGGGGGGGGW